MKSVNAKRLVLLTLCSVSVLTLVLATNTKRKQHSSSEPVSCCANPNPHHVCVMKTILGVDTSKESALLSSFKTPPMVKAAVKKGLDWIAGAQAANGGWGAGDHYRQDIRDARAVVPDPATSALVTMALLRTDNTPTKGVYSKNVEKGINYLLGVVENCPDSQPFLTTLENTQPQTKLGRNIDVILTAQCFTNILRLDIPDEKLKTRIEKALDKCVKRIQSGQDQDGSWQAGGWAPVLQSALANNALESAQDVGVDVDTVVLNRSRKYQSGNFDATTKTVATDMAAGVMLYSISGTTRASAKDARRAKDIIRKAKSENRISEEKVTIENLKKSGLSETEARNLFTANEVNIAAQSEAVREDVMTGFGNNGGEEFLSFLMTGESILMQGGDSWKKWYDMMSGKLVNMQNNDGSWNGHHCITSPVFCTATCLLILSIHNDMAFKMSK